MKVFFYLRNTFIFTVLAIILSISCRHETNTQSNTEAVESDSLSGSLSDSLSIIGISDSVIQYYYDTTLYGLQTKLIGFRRDSSKSHASTTDILRYHPDLLVDEKDAFYSADLKMNYLRGHVKSTHTVFRPYVSKRMLKDDSWEVTYEPFNTQAYKYTEHTNYDRNGSFIDGNIFYNNWKLKDKKGYAIKRYPNKRIRDLVISEDGKIGSRYFYDENGFVKYYTVCGDDYGYKVMCKTKDDVFTSYEMSGISYGDPYLYYRSFTTIDSDNHGNWTVRLCRETYYKGKLCLQEGQEKEDKTNITATDIESWQMVIDWQNDWDKADKISQFAVFNDYPFKTRHWIELRKIEYYQ
ncbi:MAG: hypothetical protein VZQ98_10020 [Bacteroidales bacterium]|nr:hypothetical protein [Bacteroidales bacterium]